MGDRTRDDPCPVDAGAHKHVLGIFADIDHLAKWTPTYWLIVHVIANRPPAAACRRPAPPSAALCWPACPSCERSQGGETRPGPGTPGSCSARIGHPGSGALAASQPAMEAESHRAFPRPTTGCGWAGGRSLSGPAGRRPTGAGAAAPTSAPYPAAGALSSRPSVVLKGGRRSLARPRGLPRSLPAAGPPRQPPRPGTAAPPGARLLFSLCPRLRLPSPPPPSRPAGDGLGFHLASRAPSFSGSNLPTMGGGLARRQRLTFRLRTPRHTEPGTP